MASSSNPLHFSRYSRVFIRIYWGSYNPSYPTHSLIVCPRRTGYPCLVQTLKNNSMNSVSGVWPSLFIWAKSFFKCFFFSLVYKDLRIDLYPIRPIFMGNMLPCNKSFDGFVASISYEFTSARRCFEVMGDANIL